mgnify:FL=1
MHKRLGFILSLLLVCLTICGQTTTTHAAGKNRKAVATRNLSHPIALSKDAKIYLLTCTPGNEVWSKYGHTGIQVQDKSNNLDIVFNYGIFSLMDDDFYIKFIKGDTYYQLGIESYRYFQRFYQSIGRATYWQELNLNQTQKQQIFDALIINYRPENRFYLYNFVFDNCATRPYHLIKNALQDSIISTYTGYLNQPYRTAISHYTGPQSWVDFGINLIFGKRADQLMNNEQRLFLPEELMFYLAEAQLSDGTPLVKNQHIQAFNIARVPWYANCWTGIIALAIILICINIIDRRRGKISWWIDLVVGVISIILLVIVIFLTFFSSHPLVGFNWRLILLPVIHLCARIIYWLR